MTDHTDPPWPEDGYFDDWPDPPPPEENPFEALTPRLGELLTHLRERLGWSQYDLARHTGIDQANISKIETGQIRKPWQRTLQRMVDVFNAHGIDVTVQQLLYAIDRPAEDYGIDKRLVLLYDRVMTQPPHFRESFIRAIYAMYDAMTAVAPPEIPPEPDDNAG